MAEWSRDGVPAVRTRTHSGKWLTISSKARQGQCSRCGVVRPVGEVDYGGEVTQLCLSCAGDFIRELI